MIESLRYTELYNACDDTLFSFNTTEELELLKQPIGQKNALEAVDFGTNIQQDGYNIYAMGPSGIGKHAAVIVYLEEKVATEKTPNDWCYVNNFSNHQKPIAIELAPGDASKFKSDIDELIELLKVILPTVFSSNEYLNERESINQKYIDAQADIFKNLQKEAKEHNVSMNTSSSSRVTFVPVIDGKILSAEEFSAIKGEEKEKITKEMSEFETIVKDNLHKVSELNKNLQKEFKILDKKITQEAVESLINEVRYKYIDSDKIVNYLDALKDDVVKNAQDFYLK